MQAYEASGMAPKRAHLYVGNLSPRVTEYMLTEIFAVAGPVQHVKIIPDRNYQHGGLNYGFVEYTDMRAAETALQTLNGRKIFDTEIRVNWAYQGTQNKEDTTNHFHVFVGDLSPEVNDEVLQKAFSAFGTLSDARVMWDMNSGKSRGYGFLAFRDKTDAEQAIATMNGEWLGSRAIRVNWANQKTSGTGGGAPMGGMGGMGGIPISPMSARPPAVGMSPMGAPAYAAQMPMAGMATGGSTYEQVLSQAPAFNTTVYVGNLPNFATQADLIPLFQGFGYVADVRMQADRGFAFVKLDTHEGAAAAIVNLQNHIVGGRAIRCSWGKDRAAGDTSAPSSAIMTPTSTVPNYGSMPMYGMPSPTAYPNYAQYGAYGAVTPGAVPALGTPGAPGADPNAAAAAAANPQWTQELYQQYWGGYYNQPGAGQPVDNKGL